MFWTYLLYKNISLFIGILCIMTYTMIKPGLSKSLKIPFIVSKPAADNVIMIQFIYVIIYNNCFKFTPRTFTRVAKNMMPSTSVWGNNNKDHHTVFPQIICLIWILSYGVTAMYTNLFITILLTVYFLLRFVHFSLSVISNLLLHFQTSTH